MNDQHLLCTIEKSPSMTSIRWNLLLSFLWWIGHIFQGNAKTSWPIVLWHGMGDTCCNPLSIGGVRDAIEDRYGVNLRPQVTLSIVEAGGLGCHSISTSYLPVSMPYLIVQEFLLSASTLEQMVPGRRTC